MREGVMPQYRFEIVGRLFDRFTWRLVELRGSRRRLLARSDQDYSSLEKVKNAIAKFREIASIAVVVNTTLPGEGPFELPPTRFEIVPGVVPLVVDESPDEDDDEFYVGVPETAQQEPARQEAARQDAAGQVQSAELTKSATPTPAKTTAAKTTAAKTTAAKATAAKATAAKATATKTTASKTTGAKATGAKATATKATATKATGRSKQRASATSKRTTRGGRRQKGT
jgi:hypothetical protein